MVKSTAETLHNDIMKILDDYVDDVERKSTECVKKVAQKGAKALRNSSPRHTGKYASGWTVKTENKRTGTMATIYNGKTPGLPHLLEHGHVIRNGTGRSFGSTKSIAHIKPVEEQIIEEFGNELKKVIQK